MFLSVMGVRLQWLIGLVSLLVMIQLGGCKVHKGVTQCEYYDYKECESDERKCTPTVQTCQDMKIGPDEKISDLDASYNHMQCYALWKYHYNANNETEMYLITKGCWMNTDKCFGLKECVESRMGQSINFCCCDDEVCNKDLFFRPSEEELKKHKLTQQKDNDKTSESNVVRRAGEEQLTNAVLYSIVPIILLGAIVVTVFFMWRRHQHHVGHTPLPTMDPSMGPTPSGSSLNLQLLELCARGRYGLIWKAQMPNQSVAVKIFPSQDKHSWKAELDIYNLPHMKHDNILVFIGSDKRDGSLGTELWLITEFHENGSLCDYLKGNTITWPQLCRIGETMTRGLAYLHDEIPASHLNSKAKPAVAHRDFKSKNVLLKNDLSACIADFGLALVFEPGNAFSETHTQVGTRRYMAPEVLEGAICFNRDSFLRIDMYACGLIIWELLARCTAADGPIEDYRLPFEAEVGLQPTLEEMQNLVVTGKTRPAFNCTWYKHLGMNNLISTVEECWDQDAEARLSADCVQERISQLMRTINSGNVGQQQIDLSPPPPSQLPPSPQAPSQVHTGVPPPWAAPPMSLPPSQTVYNTSSPYVPNIAVIDTGTLPDSYSSIPTNVNTC